MKPPLRRLVDIDSTWWLQCCWAEVLTEGSAVFAHPPFPGFQNWLTGSQYCHKKNGFLQRNASEWGVHPQLCLELQLLPLLVANSHAVNWQEDIVRAHDQDGSFPALWNCFICGFICSCGCFRTVSRVASPLRWPPPPAAGTQRPAARLAGVCRLGWRSGGYPCRATAGNPPWPEQSGWADWRREESDAVVRHVERKVPKARLFVITYTTGTVRHHQVLLKGLFLHRGWERWT